MKKSLTLTTALIGSVLLCTACLKTPLNENALKQDQPVMKTAKTSAAVRLSSKQSDTLEPGQNGTVDVDVLEAYTTGTLILKANGNETLDVFGANRELRIDMSSGDIHAWPLQFNASTDGVHYIAVEATTEGVPGPALSRAFAVRVEVGDLAAAAAKPRQDVEIQATPEGESVVVMQAEETIE